MVLQRSGARMQTQVFWGQFNPLIMIILEQINKMRQQIGLSRVDRSRNNPNIFMYYRHPYLSSNYAPMHTISRTNSGRIVSNNPERHRYAQSPKNPIASPQLKHSLRSQNDERSQRVSKLPKLSIKPQSHHDELSQWELSEQQLLAQRARQFVSRVKKQKQYNFGKAVVRKRKEQLHRRNKEKEENKIKGYYQRHLKEFKFNRLMDSILFHEQRISQRIRESIDRYRQSTLRSKTEEIPVFKKAQSIDSQSVLFEDMHSSRSMVRYSPIPAKK